jgi:cobalt/nickel transport system permease protein
MHIPDSFLDAKTAVAAGALAVVGLGVALRQASRELPPRRVPLLGLSGAFIFAAQMLNFPVGAGTSGHLIGSVLVAALLGPWAAVVVMSAVLIVQCFMFADGGVTALGANIFNMGLVAGIGGWAIYRGLSRLIPGAFGRIFGVAFAAWASTVLAAVACAGELAASSTVKWNTVYPAMAGIHMVIGVGEAVISALVYAAVTRARPDLLESGQTTGESAGTAYGSVSLAGLCISIGLVVFVGPFASEQPDGLERTAQDLQVAGLDSPVVPAPLPEYHVPGVGSPAMATAVAGTIGTLVMFVVALGLARFLTARDKGRQPTEAHGTP